MGRAGILFSHVAQAATQLVENGKNPTVDNVREALGGTGSKSTLAPLLKRWKAAHSEDSVKAELGVPSQLLEAVKSVYDQLQADVQQRLVAAVEAHQAALQAATDRTDQSTADNRALSETNGALSIELQHTRDALAGLQAEHQILNVTLATMQSDNGGLQQRLADRAAEIAALHLQLTQSRVQFEHYQEATARQRAEERQAAEQRIARGEQEWTSAQRQLAAQQSTIGQQEVRLAGLTEESMRLQEVARTAQEHAVAARSERDQLSYQLQEITSARRDLKEQLDTARQALNEARMALAGQEKETQLLTERLGHAEQKMEKLDQDRLTLLIEKAELQVFVAHRTKTDKEGE